MKAYSSIVGINFFFLLFIIGVSTLFFHTYKPFNREWDLLFNRCLTCDLAKTAAIQDFNQHQYLIVRFGLPASNQLDSNSYLLKNHGLKILQGGCMSISEINCYNNQMFELLIRKYGEQIFPLP